jgi:tetratricopeptide (TPR) repeat protein
MPRTFDELIELAKTADKDERPATAIEALTAACKCVGTLPSWYELVLADNLRTIGKIAEARRVLREIKEFPGDKAWLVNLYRGKVEEDSGDLQAAIYRYETAVEQNPNSTVPYVYLALAYSAIQQYEKAIEVLKGGLAAEGDRDEIYLNLGYQYRATGRYQEAREAFHNALKITSDYKEANVALRNVDSALDVLREAGERGRI